MSGDNITFNDKKIEKNDFYKKKNKKIFNTDDIDVNKILVSKKEYGKNNSLKYFTGYNDNVIRPLYLKLSKMTGYIRKVKGKKKTKKNTTTTTSLRVKEKQLFKNYNKIWKKTARLMRINFDSKPTYGNGDNKYIKIKIKIFADRVITNFHNRKIPEENVSYKCLSAIILDYVIKSDKQYYPQTYLEECKYKQQQQQQQQQKELY